MELDDTVCLGHFADVYWWRRAGRGDVGIEADASAVPAGHVFFVVLRKIDSESDGLSLGVVFSLEHMEPAGESVIAATVAAQGESRS